MVDALRALGVPMTVEGERVAVDRFDGLRGAEPSTAGWPAPSCASSRRGGARRRPRALRRRPARPRAADGHRAGRAADARRADRRRPAPVHPARHRRPARRRGGDRRVGVVPVRLRPAAVRRALRQGRDGGPRRQAGAVAAAHRDVGRDAAHRGRGRRRRATPNTWRVAPGPVAARDWAVEPDLSNAAVFLAAAAVTGGEVTVAGWPERSTQPGRRSCRCCEQFGATWLTAAG